METQDNVNVLYTELRDLKNWEDCHKLELIFQKKKQSSVKIYVSKSVWIQRDAIDEC